MREIILINITGKDKPGLTASLTNILAQYKVIILDIGQAVIHDYLSLGILIEIPVEHASSSILKDLLFEAHKLGIQIRFSAIDPENYEHWSSHEGQERRIITLLGRRLTGEQLAEVARAIADNSLNIDVISGKYPSATDHRRRRRCQRSSDDQHRRPGSGLPRQADCKRKCQSIHIQCRVRRIVVSYGDK